MPDLPELPEGYSWWIDKYDLRILQNCEPGPWVDWQVGDHVDHPDYDGSFYEQETRTVESEATTKVWLFFPMKYAVKIQQTRAVNVRKTVVSRLEYYDPLFLDGNRNSTVLESEELRSRMLADGPNSPANIEGRAKMLKMRFDAILANKKMIGHYPPKTTKDWT